MASKSQRPRVQNLLLQILGPILPAVPALLLVEKRRGFRVPLGRGLQPPVVSGVPRNDSPEAEVHRRVRPFPVVRRFEPVQGFLPALDEAVAGGLCLYREAYLLVLALGFVVPGQLVGEPAEGGYGVGARGEAIYEFLGFCDQGRPSLSSRFAVDLLI